jgi:hypothetical protein
MTENESPFACDMTAIAPEQRGAHLATIERCFGRLKVSANWLTDTRFNFQMSRTRY